MDRLVEIVCRSDVGLVRERNEDSVLVADLDSEEVLEQSKLVESRGQRGPLLIVCDGMGGVAGGDVASQLAAKVIHEDMQASMRSKNRSVLARSMRRAVRRANQEIVAAGEANKKVRGMGTTVSAAAFVDNMAVLAQVGDSRAYVLRNRALTQITRDQSVVSAMVQAGRISEQEAQYSMQRGRILQALGASADVEVSLSIAELRAGDCLLLCSDGLHGQVTDEGIRQAMCTDDLEGAASALVALANEAGGGDNVSVVLARFTGADLRPAGVDDELRFTEIDHAQEGPSALTTTSIVGRRLAHRAGLRNDAWPRSVPATAQHPAIRVEEGSAERAIAKHSRLGIVHYLAIAILSLAALLSLLRWL